MGMNGMVQSRIFEFIPANGIGAREVKGVPLLAEPVQAAIKRYPI
jgi:hypothetical protein